MKCHEAEKSILLQGTDELGSRKISALKEHLNTCSSCREFTQLINDSTHSLNIKEEPSAKTMQNVLRAARQQAPTVHRNIPLLMLRPALGFTAAILLGIGIFSQHGANTEQPVAQSGMVMVVTDTQFLETEQQVVEVMYSGLSEQDLAFNFLMTYEESAPEE